jgi:hypothetical protein
MAPMPAVPLATVVDDAEVDDWLLRTAIASDRQALHPNSMSILWLRVPVQLVSKALI